LKIYVKDAKDLKGTNKTDPYVKFEFENVDGKKITCGTEVKKDTLEPSWNKTYSIDIIFNKAGVIAPLLV